MSPIIKLRAGPPRVAAMLDPEVSREPDVKPGKMNVGDFGISQKQERGQTHERCEKKPFDLLKKKWQFIFSLKDFLSVPCPYISFIRLRSTDLFKDFRTHVSIIVNGQIGLISAIMVVSNLRIEKR